jgi:hypothetical protein
MSDSQQHQHLHIKDTKIQINAFRLSTDSSDVRNSGKKNERKLLFKTESNTKSGGTRITTSKTAMYRDRIGILFAFRDF